MRSELIRVRGLYLLVSFVLLLLPGRSSWAASGASPRVVIVMRTGVTSLSARIAAELRTMGFDAVEAQPGDFEQDLAAVTRRFQAVAGAKFELLDESVRLWLFDRTTGKTLMREVPRPDGVPEARLALHAVELLRASLLELSLPQAPRGELEAPDELLKAAGVPATPSSPEPPANPEPLGVPAQPPQPVEPLRTTKRPLFGLEVGPALVGAMGDLRAFPAVAVGAAYFVAPDVSVGAVGLVPLAATSFHAVEGSSENRITTLGIEMRWQPNRGAVQPFASLGPVMMLLQTRGTPEDAGLSASSDSAITFGGYARLGLGVEITTNLHFSPQALLGVQSRYFAIDYAAREAARWGPVWWAGAAMMEGRFDR